MPVGGYTKKQIREIAAKSRLGGDSSSGGGAAAVNALSKKESMGICFIGKRDMRSFLDDYISITSGRYTVTDTDTDTDTDMMRCDVCMLYHLVQNLGPDMCVECWGSAGFV
jgi:tRNA U34 2-thiouridine synthase MnmA/TrmU